MRTFVAATICVLLSTVASAASDDVPAGATQAVADYSHALMAADCRRLQELSALTHRHPEAAQPFCETVQSWKGAGMFERLRAPSFSQASGVYRMVVVPNSRVMTSEHGPLIANGFYVAVSGDRGASWSVIDIGCDRLRDWVKGEYPPYDGHPSFDNRSVDVLAAGR